ncbi:hypothetical protein SESBI_05839 [Sesbania bispinosa]|nr:hypothetical protein SESBI_05839 [Sesbania bispinosa]
MLLRQRPFQASLKVKFALQGILYCQVHPAWFTLHAYAVLPGSPCAVRFALCCLVRLVLPGACL